MTKKLHQCFMYNKVKDLQVLKTVRKCAFTGFLVGSSILVLYLLISFLRALLR